MRGKLLLWAAWGLGLGLGGVPVPAASAAENPPAGLVARVHFGGTDQLPSFGTNAARLNEWAALPATHELEEQTVRKLATAPFRFLARKVAPQAVDHPELLSPLVADLWHHESYVEIHDQTNAVPGLVLAVKVTKERAALWGTNLASVISGWTALPVAPVKMEGGEGWELKKHHDPNVIRFVHAGDWVVFGWGQDVVAGLTEMVQGIKRNGRPGEPGGESWLTAWVDGKTLHSQLIALLPFALPFETPTIQLTVGVKADYVRTKAILKFAEPLRATLPAWNLPTNTMGTPLVAFTAARSTAPLLGRLPIFQDWKIGPVPNQFSSWAVFQSVFDTSVAFPTPNPTNVLGEMGNQLIAQANPRFLGSPLGRFQWNQAHTTLEWVGLPPMVGPYLRATPSTNGNFVVGGLVSIPGRRAPPPPELLAQLAAGTNLVYYDWEITGERLKFWRNCSVLSAIVGLGNPVPEDAFQKLLNAIAGKLDNTVTELELTGPNELTLLRKSPVGLSAPELTLLERWFDTAGFPLEYAPKLQRPHPPTGNGQPVPPTAPGAPAPARNK